MRLLEHDSYMQLLRETDSKRPRTRILLNGDDVSRIDVETWRFATQIHPARYATRWMAGLEKSRKNVASCDKPRVGACSRRSADVRMG